MFKRVLTAVLGIPLLIIIVSMGRLPLLISVMFLSAIGIFELYKIFGSKDRMIFLLFEIILSIFLLIIMYRFEFFIVPYIVFLFIFNMALQIFTPNHSFIDGMLGFFRLIYVSLLLGHLLLFDNIENGSQLIWLVFITAWATDTFAYFAGVSMGKNKLCPKISPKKTIEGAIGGIIGSIIISSIYGLYLNNYGNISINLIHFVFLGIITSFISQLGDLTASMIKRNYNVKDFGNVFPGHGGVLDRFDSILFTVPIVYYYVSIFI